MLLITSIFSLTFHGQPCDWVSCDLSAFMEENNGNALTKVFFYILLISVFTVNELIFTHHKPVLHIYCINKKLIVLTNAQKRKRYRKNLKARGLYHAMKSKHAEQMRIYGQSVAGQAKQDHDKRHAKSQRTYRSKNEMSKYVVEYFKMLHRSFLNFRNGFLTRQSSGKAMKKAKRVLRNISTE